MKVEFTDSITYVIDEKNRSVKAVIKNTKYDAINTISKLMEKANLNADIPSNLELKNSYTGVAICHENDTFDIETGKKIARKIAIIRYNQDKIRVMKKFYSDFSKIEESIVEFNKNLSDTISYTFKKEEKFKSELSKF